MNVTRDEAAEALAEIGRAGRRMGRLQGYSHAGVFFIIWGIVWLVAYSVTDLRPQWATAAWAVMLVLGMGASFAAGIFQSKRWKKTRPDGATPAEARAAFSSRFGVLGGVMFFFFLCLFTVTGPNSMRETSTVVALFFPFAYMAVGAFAGWRVFAIGAVTAALIMAGYLWLTEHYYLWMGVVAGGSLIVGGLWLRKA